VDAATPVESTSTAAMKTTAATAVSSATLRKRRIRR
jgi:hypothetical protein